MKNEIIILDDKTQITPIELFTPSGVDNILANIKEKARAFVSDMTTEEGRKAIASMAYAVSRTKTALDDEGLKLTADWAAKKKLVDKERGRIKTELDALRDEIRAPLNEFEARKKERESVRNERIAEIKNLTITQAFDSVSDVQNMIKKLEELAIFDWQEFEFSAKKFAEEARTHLNSELEKGIKHEAEQKELARFRKEQEDRERKEREDLIAKQAEEKAKAEAAAEAEIQKKRVEREKLEAENAAKAREDKIEAEKKFAEQALIDAEIRAKAAVKKAEEDAVRAAAEAVKKEQERIEAERLVQEEAKRLVDEAATKIAANKKHRAKINNEALEMIKGNISGMFDNEAAKLAEESGQTIDYHVAKIIVQTIAEGRIPHISIKY